MTPQQLKNAILQQAIQGKLVEQRAEEGTGEELYKVIQDEKQQLIQEGKLKKQKALPEITEDEIPFEIPETWQWVRLGEIVYNHGQKKPSSTFSYIDIGSIDNKNQKLNENENIIEAEKAPSRARKIVHMNDVLYATVRPYLHNMCIIDKDFIYPPIASTGFAVMACYKNFYNKYLFYYLLSPSFDRYANSIENSKGVAYPAINDERLYKAVVPLPPLAEQRRIVEKIEELLLLVERYEKAWARLEELNKKFPLDMQKAILGQAIQGKLAEQRAEEGTGQELFEAIQDEKKNLIEEGKLKKQKALPEITEEEIPFEIPETWKWVRLGEISTYSQTKKKINVAAIETPMWSLDLEDIEKESGKIIRRVMTIDRKISGEKIIFKKDQILYSKLRPYLKKILIAPDNGVCSSELVPFDMIGNCDSRFIVYLLKSAYVDFLINSVTYGVKMPRVGTDTMINLLIPLPPLAEQERIVEKIEELLPLVEKLK